LLSTDIAPRLMEISAITDFSRLSSPNAANVQHPQTNQRTFGLTGISFAPAGAIGAGQTFPQALDDEIAKQIAMRAAPSR